MKKLFTLFLLAILPLTASAQVKRTINVSTAGTLPTFISDGEKYTIEELILTGELNGTDFRLIREMAGHGSDGKATNGKLSKLDMSGATIVAGGEKYLDTDQLYLGYSTFSNGIGYHLSTSDNVFGSFLFVGCEKLTEIKLPSGITSIEMSAFEYCKNLKSLMIPKTVTSLSTNIISDCDQLSSLTVEAGNTIFNSPSGSNVVLRGTTLVLGCKTSIIPNSITTVGDNAFFGCHGFAGDNGTLTLPSGVTTIENYAFADCCFSTITLPEGLKTIQWSAFARNTKLTSIVIPASVKAIGRSILEGCTGLESVVVANGNTQYDSRDNCNAIIETATNKLIEGFGITTIPLSVTTIGEDAYYQCLWLKDLVIPENITSIEDRAFWNCQHIAKITSYMKTPPAINVDVFYNVPSTTILYVPVGTKATYLATAGWEDVFGSDRIVEMQTPATITKTLHVATAGSLSSMISDEEKYTISELVLTGELNGTDFRLIRDMAGNDYQGNLTNGKLSKLDLSGTTIVSGGDYYINTTTIHWTDNTQMVLVNPIQLNTNNNELGSFLFAGCKSLETIILPKNITAIGSSVFSHNLKLRSLEIPKSVSSLSDGFIQECKDLSSLSVESGNQTYSSPEGSNAVIHTADMRLEAGCKNTFIPSGTKIIGAYAFQHCTSLRSIKIPESIIKIEGYAFWGCSGLTELNIPASVTQIGYMAFYACSALNSIIVDSDNSVYDSRNNCNALIETSSNTLLLGCKNTIIPNGILSIGENAFRPCDGLTSIEIPASVISIGDNAFAYCNQLRRVVSNIVDPNTVVMGSTVFDRISESAILIVPQGTKASYMAADGWKDAFSKIAEMGDQDPNTIDVAVAGTLSSMLIDPLQIEELTITGNLNGTDLRLIREMAGNDYLGQPTSGMLRKLDLSGANIVAGGEKYLDTDRITSSTGTYTQWGWDAFHYSTENNVLGSSLFAGCDKLEEVILPNSITSIGNYVFWYCLNLGSLMIPEHVSSIGWQLVYGPNNISKLGVSDGNMYYTSPANSNVIMQGTKLLYGCNSSIIPAETTEIGADAFPCYNGNPDFVIPEGVTSIGENALSWSNIRSITIPKSIKEIGDMAFMNCSALQDIYSYIKEPFDIANSVFPADGQYLGLTTTLHVPFGTKDAYLGAQGWKNIQNIVEMGETAPVTIGKSGKASYCGDKSLDFSGSEEIKAYIATGFDETEGTIWLTRVKDVPAGTPVLIKGEANQTYQVPVTDSQNSYYTNMFKGNISGATVQVNETDGDLVNYYLSGDGTFKSVNNYVNIGNNKSYLQLPGTFNAAETGATQTVKIGSIGKASFAAPVDLDFTNVEGLKAFTATGYDKSTKTIWLTRVMKVQKGEGVLLKGDAKDYTIPSSAVQSSYKNMFVGNTSGASVQVQATSEDGSQTNFYLKGDGTFVSVNGYVNIGNNKSYLALPTSMVAAASTRGAEANYIMEEPEVIKLPISFRSLDNDGNGTTAIREAKSSREDSAYYTLQGQRVENPGKGLYIKNGKKVVIK